MSSVDLTIATGQKPNILGTSLILYMYLVMIIQLAPTRQNYS